MSPSRSSSLRSSSGSSSKQATVKSAATKSVAVSAKPAVVDTGNFSFLKGNLPKGCQYCVKGEKLVLFITGLCGMHCFYCPVSEKKIRKDVIYANEWKTESVQDVLEEARLTDAKGAGITGGDPLVVVDRVCDYIRLLKKEFGKDFHIHLYTTLQLVTEERLQKLYDAGLDEIRFHFNLDDQSWWPRVLLATDTKKYSWDTGAEIPCIPGKKKEILALIDFLKDKVQFLNLNELELSEPNSDEFCRRNLATRNPQTYAIQGSYELALEILNERKDVPLSLYFCTAKLKDAVQMKNRIARRAVNVKQPFDTVTDDGTLIRGVIYLKDLEPSFGYRRKLAGLDAEARTAYGVQLKALRKKLIERFAFTESNLLIDELKLRLIGDLKKLHKHKKALQNMGVIPASVEEFPTRDAIELEIEYL